MWTFGDFRLDPDRFELTRGANLVPVEPQVVAFLVHLVRHRDRLVLKDEIVDAVWGGRAVSDASISSRVRSARKAVGDDGESQTVIRTVHGRGFRFVAAVDEVGPTPVVEQEPPSKSADQFTGKPSIAVLPFRPLALSPELAVLADAIPHEIIQGLSRLRWLAVIARGSSFRFRQGSPDLDLVATALGARYILSGLIEATASSIV
ncbi:MAG: winged helix-turn-helix domain-containing protein, partial [Rhizobiaceae bacterium]|nr:winged helix-turn-helix domain-containing protein [Rhizobiaceae bacterium]